MKSLIKSAIAIPFIEIPEVSLIVGVEGVSVYTKLKNDEVKIDCENNHFKEILKNVFYTIRKDFSLKIHGIISKVLYRKFCNLESIVLPFSISLFEACGEHFEEEILINYLAEKFSLDKKLLYCAMFGNLTKYTDKYEGSFEINCERILIYKLNDVFVFNEEFPQPIRILLKKLIDNNYFEEGSLIYSSLLYSQSKIIGPFIWDYYKKECYIGGNRDYLIVISPDRFPRVFSYIAEKVYKTKPYGKFKVLI